MSAGQLVCAGAVSFGITCPSGGDMGRILSVKVYMGRNAESPNMVLSLSHLQIEKRGKAMVGDTVAASTALTSLYLADLSFIFFKGKAIVQRASPAYLIAEVFREIKIQINYKSSKLN